MDALLVLQGLNDSDINTSFDLIINDIKKLASYFSICFTFAKRHANTTAHLLAREAVARACCMEWFSILFNYLLDVVNFDMN